MFHSNTDSSFESKSGHALKIKATNATEFNSAIAELSEMAVNMPFITALCVYFRIRWLAVLQLNG